MSPVAAAPPTVIVNGEARTLPPGTDTVAALVCLLALTGKRVAVELNGAIIPRSRHADTIVNAGDRIEIVVAVGGG